MFNLTDQTITISSTCYPMDRFEVWFRTPFGLFDKIEDAVAKCRSIDVDPELVIYAIPVAVTKSGIYEVLMR